MIDKLALIFGSKTKAQEMVFLLHNVKNVVRQGFYPSELGRVEEFCKNNNLYLVKSKFKVLVTNDHIYSNKGLRIDLDDTREGMYFTYISKDEKTALLASYDELTGNDYELGLVLGYPSCCVQFFCRHFNEKNPDLQLPATNLFTNLTARNQDCVLLSHFPCSSDCSESIRIAEHYAALLKSIDLQRYQKMITLLQFPSQ
ncbi:MAG: DUF483 domain-containing protein [Nanoarchaeota archaeon]|nr:DUF483 domain-containing protein [Nanoarchaeota archaeon]